jgi:hypothetical protein
MAGNPGVSHGKKSSRLITAKAEGCDQNTTLLSPEIGDAS